ncbi:MAG: ankyrin repeat domain-containing protein [Candidatus Latescibacteria bacterium]|jgi:ankyrin repeat protein|nr:ankyrin repeat domain-containing protein [Candidatus Latescibacterota bacterium]
MDKALAQRWRLGFQAAGVEAVREMLAKEPSLAQVEVEHTMKNGKTRVWGPLFSGKDDLEKVVALVEAGADLSNSHLGTHWPSDSYEVNRYLVDQEVDINQPSYLGFHAVGVSDLDTFFLMLDNGLDPNFAWPYNGETLLHVQARDDNETHFARAYCLIKAGADVNAQALSGLDEEPIMNNEHFIEYGKETPLHFVARLGNPRLARLLLDQGADPTLKTVSRMKQPKETEPWEGEVEALTWPMTKHERVVFESYGGETALEMALREGNGEVAQMIQRA